MKRKVILILLDACRSDYITANKTPFLARLAKENLYYKSLVPSFGFCERTEILVGQDPLESRCFTAFGYCPELSPYRRYRYLLIILGWIEERFKSNLVSKVFRRLIWEIFRYKDGAFYPARIPLSNLSDFCLTEDAAINLIEDSHLSLYQIADGVFTEATTSMNSYLAGTDQNRLDRVLDSIDESFDFYPTYVSILDSIGHKYGPDSSEMKNAIQELDVQLDNFYKALERTEQDTVAVFCGDHGMSPVTSSVDIQKITICLKKKQHLLSGFRMFLDSTMARFWFESLNSPDVEILISEINSHYSGEGFFIEKDDYHHFGIPTSGMYGDMIWVCNEGTIISPDYFNAHDKRILGMHGYRPSGAQHYGFAIVAGKNIEAELLAEPKPLVTIYKELKKHIIKNKDLT